jgi:hypothetical protein
MLREIKRLAEGEQTAMQPRISASDIPIARIETATAASASI